MKEVTNFLSSGKKGALGVKVLKICGVRCRISTERSLLIGTLHPIFCVTYNDTPLPPGMLKLGSSGEKKYKGL